MIKEYKDNFVALILTNGRPDRVFTYDTLRRSGYTGPIRLVIDNLDKTRDEYIKKYGDEVIIFDKHEIAKTFDQGDNFNDMRAIIYARNASFKIARDLGFTYFVQLDDDYTNFSFRFNKDYSYIPSSMRKLDTVFNSILKFFISSPSLSSISLAQGGDFIGGSEGTLAQKIKFKRKCMNSFFCSTEREFKFVGRINEDVNTYTHEASKGLLFFTTNQVSLTQKQTQTNSGGMTELYLDSGTYIKSFYSVMYQPSSVKIRLMGNQNRRLHHSVSWRSTVPLLLSESVRK